MKNTGVSVLPLLWKHGRLDIVLVQGRLRYTTTLHSFSSGTFLYLNFQSACGTDIPYTSFSETGTMASGVRGVKSSKIICISHFRYKCSSEINLFYATSCHLIFIYRHYTRTQRISGHTKPLSLPSTAVPTSKSPRTSSLVKPTKKPVSCQSSLLARFVLHLMLFI